MLEELRREGEGLEGGEEESESGGSGEKRVFIIRTNGPRDSGPASDDVVLTTRTFSRTYSRTRLAFSRICARACLDGRTFERLKGGEGRKSARSLNGQLSLAPLFPLPFSLRLFSLSCVLAHISLAVALFNKILIEEEFGHLLRSSIRKGGF